MSSISGDSIEIKLLEKEVHNELSRYCYICSGSLTECNLALRVQNFFIVEFIIFYFILCA